MRCGCGRLISRFVKIVEILACCGPFLNSCGTSGDVALKICSGSDEASLWCDCQGLLKPFVSRGAGGERIGKHTLLFHYKSELNFTF